MSLVPARRRIVVRYDRYDDAYLGEFARLAAEGQLNKASKKPLSNKALAALFGTNGPLSAGIAGSGDEDLDVKRKMLIAVPDCSDADFKKLKNEVYASICGLPVGPASAVYHSLVEWVGDSGKNPGPPSLRPLRCGALEEADNLMRDSTLFIDTSGFNIYNEYTGSGMTDDEFDAYVTEYKRQSHDAEGHIDRGTGGITDRADKAAVKGYYKMLSDAIEREIDARVGGARRSASGTARIYTSYINATARLNYMMSNYRNASGARDAGGTVIDIKPIDNPRHDPAMNDKLALPGWCAAATQYCGLIGEPDEFTFVRVSFNGDDTFNIPHDHDIAEAVHEDDEAKVQTVRLRFAGLNADELRVGMGAVLAAGINFAQHNHSLCHRLVGGTLHKLLLTVGFYDPSDFVPPAAAGAIAGGIAASADDIRANLEKIGDLVYEAVHPANKRIIAARYLKGSRVYVTKDHIYSMPGRDIKMDRFFSPRTRVSFNGTGKAAAAAAGLRALMKSQVGVAYPGIADMAATVKTIADAASAGALVHPGSYYLTGRIGSLDAADVTDLLPDIATFVRSNMANSSLMNAPVFTDEIAASADADWAKICRDFGMRRGVTTGALTDAQWELIGSTAMGSLDDKAEVDKRRRVLRDADKDLSDSLSMGR